MVNQVQVLLTLKFEKEVTVAEDTAWERAFQNNIGHLGQQDTCNYAPHDAVG